MAPVQGKNLSNLETVMAGLLPDGMPVTLTDEVSLGDRATRAPEPDVPNGPGNVPGTDDSGRSGARH